MWTVEVNIIIQYSEFLRIKLHKVNFLSEINLCKISYCLTYISPLNFHNLRYIIIILRIIYFQ